MLDTLHRESRFILAKREREGREGKRERGCGEDGREGE